MSSSQISYQIKLLFSLDNYQNDESRFILVSEFDSDPCISIGEKISVLKCLFLYKEDMCVREKEYILHDIEVVDLKREITFSLYKLEIESQVELGVNYNFTTVYFIEAKNSKELVFEMFEFVENNTLLDLV